LPGTQAFVGISRALFLFDFGVAVLCGFGVEFLVRRVSHCAGELEPRPSPAPLLALSAALVFMGVCVSYGVTVHAESAFHPLLRDFTLSQIYRWLAFTTLGFVVIFLALRVRADAPAALRSFALYALPVLVAADLLAFAWSQNPEAEKSMAFFETPSISWLKRHIGTQRFIAVGTDALKHWTPSNTLMAYGLRDAQGSDSLMTMRIFRFLQTWDANSPLHRAFAVRNFDSPLLDLMAVKFVVAAEPLSAEERKDLRLVHAGDLWVYENPKALPRAFAVFRWRWAKSPQEALKEVRSPNFDPHETAILERLQGDTRGMGGNYRRDAPFSLPAPHPVFSDRINTLKVEVKLPRPAALVISDGAYPGWRAFGKEVGAEGKGWRKLPVFVADYAFKAVLLPEGSWRVVWVYFPGSVVVGLFLCLTAIGALVAVAVLSLAGEKGSGE